VLVTSGVLSRNCIAEVRGNLLALTDGDVVIFDGQEVRSLLQDRMKRWLFAQIDTTNFRNAYVLANPAQSEVWVCFPETGATYPNLALVWDTNTDSWGVRPLTPEAAHIGRGIIPDTNVDPTWDGDAQSWDLDGSRWNQSTFNPTNDGLVGADLDGAELLELDAGLLHADGTDVEGAIGKDSMSLSDAGTRKLITALWPAVEAAQPLALTVRVGVQDRFSDPIAWLPAQTFNPATDEKVDVLASGRYISVHFSSRSATRWRLSGFALQLAPAGEY